MADLTVSGEANWIVRQPSDGTATRYTSPVLVVSDRSTPSASTEPTRTADAARPGPANDWE